ncbi:MAG: hypothetical protein GYA16_15640, partial [Spirochaetes bacterium]|nr:hypothetical protein [Spirochaetota bacterium]
TLYQHPFLNLAYGILDHDENDTVDIPSLNQRDVYTQIGTDLSGFPRAGYSPDVIHPLANVVAVTNIDNPLVAPPAYRLSLAGTVTGIGINTSPLATEPHGTHPVIIITKNGLVAVQLSSEGYPQWSVAIGGEPGIEGQTLSGQGYILYNSNRGLQLWQSGRSVAIQEIIAGITKGNRITGAVHDKLTTNLTAIVGYLSNDNKDYLSMIANGQLIIDDTYNELIICNPDYNYALVYNIETKMWYKRTDTYNIIMYGNKPHGINNGKIYDLTAEDYDEPTDCYILTLPVKISSDNINKHLSHITVNGLLDSGNNIVAMAIYGSLNDYTPYYPVVATATKGQKPLIASKSGYSNVYYIIEIAGKLLKDSYISHLSGDVRIT